jgi:MFS family permease
MLSDHWLAHTSSARFLTAALALGAGVPFGLLAVFAPTWPLYLVSIFATTLLLSSCLTPLTAFVQEESPSQWRATAMAFALFATQVVGGATAVPAVGALSDAVGLRTAMLLPLGAALLGSLALLFGAHRRPPKSA